VFTYRYCVVFYYSHVCSGYIISFIVTNNQICSFNILVIFYKLLVNFYFIFKSVFV